MTTELDQSLQRVLTRANPQDLADALRAANMGHMLADAKAVFTGLTAAAAQDITTAAAKAAVTLTGMTLDSGENLPPIGQITYLRVTAGAAAAGARIIGDAGATPSATVAALSDDGTTITFEGTVTAFVLGYRPRIATAMGTDFGTPGI